VAIHDHKWWGFTPLFQDGFSKTRKEKTISFLSRNKVFSLFLKSDIAKSPAHLTAFISKDESWRFLLI